MKNDTVADRMRVIRGDQGLKQTDMAEMLKISYPSLAAYENGKTEPNFKTLQHLSNLNYNLNWLVSGKGEMKCEDVNNHQGFNAGLLEELLIVSNRFVYEYKLNVSADKLSKIVAMAYKDFQATGQIDEPRLLELLQIVSI